MKDKIVIDVGQIMDEIFEATRSFGDAFSDQKEEGKRRAEEFFKRDENVDYYPSYSYPPMNLYLTQQNELVFEFALAGFHEKDMQIEFQGDYMLFSAKGPDLEPEDDVRYFKRRLKFKDIENQRYFVPEDKFDRNSTKAVYKNGILQITVPPKENVEAKEGIKVTIEKEDEE
ncbi:MAG: Hsp20/alpha crystallin family protein [Spirochaetaceae bacterium]